MKKIYIPLLKSVAFFILFLQFSFSVNAQGTIRGLVFSDPEVKLDAGIVSLFVLEDGYYSLYSNTAVDPSDTTLYSYEFNEIENGTYIVLAAVGQNSEYAAIRQSTYHGGTNGVVQWKEAQIITIAADSGMADTYIPDPIILQTIAPPDINWYGNSSIRGTVEFPTPAMAKTTEAVESAVVTLYTSTGDRLTSTYTDPFGDYSFEGIAEGEYEIGVEYPGVSSSSRIDVTASGQTTAAPPIEITRQLVGLNKRAVVVHSLDLYPNPVSRNFNVQVPDFNGPGTLRIINSFGSVLLEEPVSNNNLLTIDGSFLNPGVYFVEITNDGSVSRTRFTKN